MPDFSGVGGGLGGFLGSLAGWNETEPDRNAIDSDAAMGLYQGTNFQYLDPRDVQMRSLARYQSPENEQALQMGPSAFGDIQSDPALRQAQMAALAQQQGEAGQAGMGLEDRIAQSQAQAQQARQEQGQRQAILAAAQSRGQLGGGAQLGAQLNAQSAGATSGAAAAQQAALGARMRALQSMQGAGQLGGQIRGQDYGEAANRAAAQDAISRFNTANSQAVQQRNVANRMNQANMNTDAQNQRGYFNAQQVGNAYKTNLGAHQQQANAYYQNADERRKKIRDMMDHYASVGQGAGTAAGGAASFIPGG